MHSKYKNATKVHNVITSIISYVNKR